jgi:hypothetical protein
MECPDCYAIVWSIISGYYVIENIDANNKTHKVLVTFTLHECAKLKERYRQATPSLL